MLMASTMTFAGDSPALKAIMKGKSYSEVEQLIKENFDQLVNDEERAKAYSKLVDYAMQKVSKESGAMLEIQANAQAGIKKDIEVDTQGLCDALINAINAAVICNKYDQLPNAKGKVDPKYAEKNIQRIWAEHRQLLAYGDQLRQQNDYANALKYWAPYLDIFQEPMFADQDHAQEKETIEQVSYMTAWMALHEKQPQQAIKYAKIAMTGQYKEEALRVMLEAMASNLQTREDSLRYAGQLKDLLNQEPDNETYLSRLYELYGDLHDTQAQIGLLDATLERNPKNFIALADKGLFAYNDGKYDEAEQYLRKAVDVKPENAFVRYYLGMSLCGQAQGENVPDAKKKELYKAAIEVFDKCKEIDPDKQQVNWGYGRQNAYYNFYGPDSKEFKAAEADYRN